MACIASNKSVDFEHKVIICYCFPFLAFMHNTESPYDLAVAYRVYPKISKSPAIYKDDKYKLTELCLYSFKHSLGILRAKIWVLMDACPPEYEALFRRHFATEDLVFIHLKGIGNEATLALQIELLMEQNESEAIYFAEDDYFYLPDQFRLMREMLEEPDVDFVSPYDHLDYYTLDMHKSQPSLKLLGDKHWRTANSTCMTFLTTRKMMQKTVRSFDSYGTIKSDAILWLALTKAKKFLPLSPLRLGQFLRYYKNDWKRTFRLAAAWLHCSWQSLFGRQRKLWVPIPTIATHLESEFLSPGVDWETRFYEAQKAIADHNGPNDEYKSVLPTLN